MATQGPAQDVFYYLEPGWPLVLCSEYRKWRAPNVLCTFLLLCMGVAAHSTSHEICSSERDHECIQRHAIFLGELTFSDKLDPLQWSSSLSFMGL